MAKNLNKIEKRKDKENSGNYVAFSPEFSNGQSSRTKFLNAPRIKSRIFDVLKTSNTINRIVHKEKFIEIVKAIINKMQIFPSLLLTIIAISSILIFLLLALFILPSLISATQFDSQQAQEIKTIDSCKKIDIGGRYILTKDILDVKFEESIGGCLVFNAPNIEFDCQGHAILSSSEKTVGLTINKDDATVKNCFISMQDGTGIAVLDSSKAFIINNTLKENKYSIFLYSSYNNSIENNFMERNQYGLTLATSSDNNFIKNNKINESLNYAVFLSGSSNNLLKDLYVTDTRGDVLLFGAASSNNVLNNILITGTDQLYFDLLFEDAGNDNNTIIDSYFNKYDLNNGNRLNFLKNGIGEVNFLETISGAGQNLSDDIRILNNSISIAENHRGLNKSASLTFFGARRDLSNYTMMRNNLPCPRDICINETALDAGKVKIVVNGSGAYSISGIKLMPEAPKPFCIDSDNGLDYGEKGNVSYLTKITQSSESIQNPGNVELVTYGASTSFDYCITNMTLIEYSCFSNETGSFPDSARYNCANGCTNSACIAPTPELNQSIPPSKDKSKKDRNLDDIRFIPSTPRFTIQNISFFGQEDFDSSSILNKEILDESVSKRATILSAPLMLLVIFNILALIILLVFVLEKSRRISQKNNIEKQAELQKTNKKSSGKKNKKG